VPYVCFDDFFSAFIRSSHRVDWDTPSLLASSLMDIFLGGFIISVYKAVM